MSEKPVSRRRFVAGVGTTGGGLLLGSALGVGPRALAAAPVQVPRRILGKTGAKIPILLMGGSMSLDQRFDPKLAEGFRYGVNYFDSAANYTGGNSERAVGAFVTRLNARNKVWITTKTSKKNPAAIEQSLHESLDRLQTDYADMFFLHGLNNPALINADLQALVERMKKEKKFRHFGFSCHDGNVNELLDLAAKTPWIDAVMFR